MNINIDYEGKNYNFDIPKNVKIDYLKELSSKIFKSDKTLLELIYNNQKLEQKNEDALVLDLIPKGQKSTVLTVQMNEDNQKENPENIKNALKSEEKIKTNEIIKKNSSNKIINKNNNNINLDKDINNNEIYENKLFIANYIRKSNELFATMKDFNDKIKEVDNSLNKKMKTYDYNTDNNIFYYELSLFEKRAIDFLKSQIIYFKKLIKSLNQSNNNENKEFNLENFYNTILLNSNEFDQENILNEKIKKNKLSTGKKINKSSSKLNNAYDKNYLNAKLPLLKSNNLKNNKNLYTINNYDKKKKNDYQDILGNLSNIKNPRKNKNYILDEIKLRPLNLNLKTETKNIDNNTNGKKETKYQKEEVINKEKINRKNIKDYSPINKKINNIEENIKDDEKNK